MSEEKIISIIKPFSETYTLEIESATKAISLDTYSKVRLRWNFQVLEIDDKQGIICNLIKTEQKLIETNNPIVKEIQQVSSVFGRMYSEVKVHLDSEGKVLKVLNSDLILDKWKETKDEMQKYITGNPDLENSISLNDEIFQDPEKVKVAVQAQEFFEIYFARFFGKKLPFSNKAITAPNLFNTANLHWIYDIDGHLKKEGGKTIAIIKTIGKESDLSIGFNNKAYAQFKEHLNIYNIHAKIRENSEHTYDFEDGKLLEAKVVKQEIVDPQQLHVKHSYTIQSESSRKKKS